MAIADLVVMLDGYTYLSSPSVINPICFSLIRSKASTSQVIWVYQRKLDNGHSAVCYKNPGLTKLFSDT
jgi:hypothetical protein